MKYKTATIKITKVEGGFIVSLASTTPGSKSRVKVCRTAYGYDGVAGLCEDIAASLERELEQSELAP